MVLSAYHAQPLPPSGMAYAVALHLLPAAPGSSSSSRESHRGKLVSHLVTARDDVVDVYEIRQKAGPAGPAAVQESVYHLRSHPIFGIVTGLGKCKVDARSEDYGQDTLIISFKDAKMAMMQWSEAAADLVTVSIHTYERAPQVAEGLAPQFMPILRVDPDSRCAALLLPQDALAILPFYNDTADELDELLEKAGGTDDQIAIEKALPYAPSFVLSLLSADSTIKNVRDFVFLPSFQRPTVAVLFEKDATWTGRLDERHDTCALRIVTLDLTVAANPSHRVISSKDGLPFDSLYLTACPQSVGGGVYIASASAIIHMDQGGKTVGVAVNGWHGQTSKMTLPRWKAMKPTEANRTADANGVNGHANGTLNGDGSEADLTQLSLANSHIIFPDPSSPSALLFLENGSAWLVKNALEGRSLASISLEAKGTSVQPSLTATVPSSDLLLVGSMIGSSQVLKMEGVDSSMVVHDATKIDADDMDLDAELYGDSPTSNNHSGNGTRSSRIKVDFELHLAATIDHLGPVLHASPAVVGDADSLAGGRAGGLAQTVVCAGAGAHGGLSLLEPQIIPRDKRQLTLNATEGIWYIRTDRSADRTVLVTSNANGSEIATIDQNALVSSNVGLRDRTVFACSTPGTEQLDHIIRVTNKGVGIIDERGRGQQWTNLGEDKADDLDIFNAAFCAGYLTILWADGSLQLFELLKARLQEVLLPDEMASRKYVAANVLRDTFATFTWLSKTDDGKAPLQKGTSVEQNQKTIKSAMTASFSGPDQEDDEVDYGDDMDEEQEPANAIAAAVDAEPAKDSGTLWLALTSSEACLQIYSMPDMRRVWQSNSLYPAPSRLDYVAAAAEEEEAPSLELSQVQLSHIGDVLHLTVAFQNGLVNVYEANASPGDDEETMQAMSEAAHEGVLALSFIKILAKQLDVAGSGVLNAPNGESVEGLSLAPFDDLNGLRGLFIGGVAPAWLIRDRCGPTYLHMSAEASMDHLCAVGKGSQFVYVQYGMVSMAHLPALDFSLPIAHQKKARTHRTYTKAAPHPLSKTILATSVVEQQFVLFDPEDGHVVEDPSVDPTMATAPRSALELFVDGEPEPVDGYEFQQCEMVSCIELVTLRSVGSMSGLKDYVAVGTVISHGEDRPARGATYIFDVVEVVAPEHDSSARFKLRMMVKDDCKGPITGMTDINGYLVVVMGLKLFVRSLEKDEWLITIAFLDTPFQATSLQRLKNFLLLTDVHRSVWLIAFQEEPYRLVVISKDYNELYQACGSFLIHDEEMTIVAAAKDGVLRLYDYAPTIPASQGGQRLLVRSEYACASESSCRIVIPGPASADGGIATSCEIVLGMMNGGIQLIQPVDEEIFNTLHLLQGQLVRNVQHFAGLNPRGFRVVANELTSRPLTKGILDGRLLAAFEMLSRPKMEELAKLIPDLVDGADQLLRYIATLRSSWGAL